jgi:protein SCO1/2
VAPPAPAAPSAQPVARGPGREYPNPLLVTHEGREVRLYDDLLRDGAVILSFGYARCTGSCPATNATLKRVAAALGERVGRDVRLLTLTLDPEHDRPEVLRRHADLLGAPPGWTFLTGAPADLDAVRRFFGLRDRDPAADEDRGRHAGLLVVGSAARDRWATLPAAAGADEVVALVLRTGGGGGQRSGSGAPRSGTVQR